MDTGQNMNGSLNQEYISPLRKIAIMLLEAGMSFSDVVIEIHSLAKTLVPQGNVAGRASLAAEYTSEATKGLGPRATRRYEMK